jgi:hypothetical protein
MLFIIPAMLNISSANLHSIRIQQLVFVVVVVMNNLK